MDEFTLTIIGSGSALPMHGRHPSAQVVQYNDLCCLIDCGEGTQERLRPAGVRPFQIDIILISHLHGDHIFGLPGLLSSYTHLGRTAPLSIFGPVGLKGFLECIIGYTELKLSFSLSIIEESPETLCSVFKRANFEIWTFPLYHRIACNGYLFRELSSNIRLNKERLQEYGLTPVQIKAVKREEEIENLGSRVPASVFILEPLPPLSYAYCSDTRYDLRLLPSIQGVSVLYHETTFMNDLEEMADQTGHSTSSQAGMMASAARVSCLVTGHYSSRYKDVSPLVEEAGKHFRHVIESEEGKKYNLRNLAKGLEQ
ncbi:MAG: ribonuclease Z [Saprospiraceae bacterium]|nr:ribonuclease Z [Saprospiraceae bacterium]